MNTNSEYFKRLRPEIQDFLTHMVFSPNDDKNIQFHLDKNENPYDLEFTRFSNTSQEVLKKRIAEWRQIHVAQIFISNGILQSVDFLLRLFCRSKHDRIQVLLPSDIDIERLATLNDIQVERYDRIEQLNPYCKLTYISNPNPIHGEALEWEQISTIASTINGLVMVNESLMDFSSLGSALPHLEQHENLVLLHSFDHALGGAGLNLGLVYANPSLIEILESMDIPHSINQLSQEAALMRLDELEDIYGLIREVQRNRNILSNELKLLSFIKKVYSSQANFLLIQVEEVKRLEQFLLSNGIRVMNCSSIKNYKDCLRITIGSPEENHYLLQQLIQFDSNKRGPKVTQL